MRCILLKGPSFAAWLYRDGDARPYTDVDLLIARETVPAAHAVLAEREFKHFFDSSPFFVRGLDQVDLHCSIKGVEVNESRPMGGAFLDDRTPEGRGPRVGSPVRACPRPTRRLTCRPASALIGRY